MTKILLVFRGENKRWNSKQFHDVRDCIPNNKKRIIDSLRNAGHQVTVYFCTYDSEHLKDFTEAYTAEKVFCMDFKGSSQHKNFKFALDSIAPFVNEFDKIIFLRFDFLYKKDISEWSLIDQKEGHVFLWKDASKEAYEKTKYCMDGLFLLDPKYFNEFKNMYDNTYERWLGVTNGLHFLTTELYNYKTIPYSFLEGEDTYWSSNTTLPDPSHNNPYFINFIYQRLGYHCFDYHLTNV